MGRYVRSAVLCDFVVFVGNAYLPWVGKVCIHVSVLVRTGLRCRPSWDGLDRVRIEARARVLASRRLAARCRLQSPQIPRNRVLRGPRRGGHRSPEPCLQVPYRSQHRWQCSASAPVPTTPCPVTTWLACTTQRLPAAPGKGGQATLELSCQCPLHLTYRTYVHYTLHRPSSRIACGC